MDDAEEQDHRDGMSPSRSVLGSRSDRFHYMMQFWQDREVLYPDDCLDFTRNAINSNSNKADDDDRAGRVHRSGSSDTSSPTWRLDTSSTRAHLDSPPDIFRPPRPRRSHSHPHPHQLPPPAAHSPHHHPYPHHSCHHRHCRRDLDTDSEGHLAAECLGSGLTPPPLPPRAAAAAASRARARHTCAASNGQGQGQGRGWGLFNSGSGSAACPGEGRGRGDFNEGGGGGAARVEGQGRGRERLHRSASRDYGRSDEGPPFFCRGGGDDVFKSAASQNGGEGPDRGASRGAGNSFRSRCHEGGGEFHSACQEGQGLEEKVYSTCQEGQGCGGEFYGTTCQEGQGRGGKVYSAACQEGQGRGGEFYSAACQEGQGRGGEFYSTACQEDQGRGGDVYSTCEEGDDGHGHFRNGARGGGGEGHSGSRSRSNSSVRAEFCNKNGSFNDDDTTVSLTWWQTKRNWFLYMACALLGYVALSVLMAVFSELVWGSSSSSSSSYFSSSKSGSRRHSSTYYPSPFPSDPPASDPYYPFDPIVGPGGDGDYVDGCSDWECFKYIFN